MLDVITIGDASQDIFLQMDESEAHLHNFRQEGGKQLCLNFASKLPVKAKHDCVGGNASNAAVAFARLGFNTAIYAHLGNDATGRRITAELKANGVSERFLSVDKNQESNYNTIINYEGERTILVYHQKRRYVLPKLQASRWVYLTSMSEGFEDIIPDIISYVKENNAMLCYQPGTFQLKYGPKKLSQLLRRTKIIFMNKEEAERYLEIEPVNDDMPKLLNGLTELGPEIAVITNGADGSYAYDGRNLIHLEVIENVPRIDTTGAGDSFASGFTAAFINGLSIEEALLWGQCEASSVIQQFGAQTGLLYKKQLTYLYQKYKEMVKLHLIR